MEAVRDCGSDLKDLDPYRVGVIVGCGIGGLELTEQEHSKYLEKGPGKISVFYVPMMIGNMAAGTISMKTGFKGDNFSHVPHQLMQSERRSERLKTDIWTQRYAAEQKAV